MTVSSKVSGRFNSLFELFLCCATMKRLSFTALPSLCVGIWAVGCGRPSGDLIRLNSDVRLPEKSAVIFFVDGMDGRRFEALLREGLLPNIEKRFVRGGVGVKHAIVSMPSITYANAVSLLTGLFPGHHGILGNQWFDRHTLRHQDYSEAATYRNVNDDFDRATLYDLLKDRLTVNVQGHTRRGVTCTFDNMVESGIDWIRGDYINVDRRVGYRLKWVSDLANRVRRWPTVLMNYFPGVDKVAHEFGVDSPDYARAMQNVDLQIGRVIDAVFTAGLEKSTYFALVTDHGHVQRGDGRTFDIVDWLKQHCKFRIQEGRADSQSYLSRFHYMDRYDAVVINGAYRRTGIHLKGPNGWADPASEAEIECVLETRSPLQEQPGVALVCVRNGKDRVKVVSRDGHFIVERRMDGNRRNYRMVMPQKGANFDPLRYRESGLGAFIDSSWHDSREWLAATAATRYPDFVPQVIEMFDSPRAGDIVVFADDDWAFDNREPSGHGSCLAEDMCVPMYYAGPSLPPGGRIDHARLVDVMPTILGLLGESTRLSRAGSIDGVDLASQLRSALQTEGP